MDNAIGSDLNSGRPRVNSSTGLNKMRKNDSDDDVPQDEEIKESERQQEQYNLEDSDNEGLNKNMKGSLQQTVYKTKQ